MALAFFDELEGGIISIIDVVAKFGKMFDLNLTTQGGFSEVQIIYLILASWFAFVDVDEDQLIDRNELQQFFMTQLELNGELISCFLQCLIKIFRSTFEKRVHAVKKAHHGDNSACDQKS